MEELMTCSFRGSIFKKWTVFFKKCPLPSKTIIYHLKGISGIFLQNFYKWKTVFLIRFSLKNKITRKKNIKNTNSYKILPMQGFIQALLSTTVFILEIEFTPGSKFLDRGSLVTSLKFVFFCFVAISLNIDKFPKNGIFLNIRYNAFVGDWFPKPMH